MSIIVGRQIGPFNLGAACPLLSLTSSPFVAVGPTRRVSLQLTIDGGSDGVAPTDNPLGTFELHAAGDESAPMSLVSGPVIGDTDITALAAVGNTLVNVTVRFDFVPGTRMQVRYLRASGGETSRARLWITTS